MADKPTRQRTIPRRSDDELRQLATVDDDALADAADYWRGKAPAKYRGLVDAKEEEEDKP